MLEFLTSGVLFSLTQECMTEAFNPIRYLDYWERTSPQERCSRRPTYEEHDNRKAVYEEHDHRKVDYAKIYGPPKAPMHRQRSNPERLVLTT